MIRPNIVIRLILKPKNPIMAKVAEKAIGRPKLVRMATREFKKSKRTAQTKSMPIIPLFFRTPSLLLI